MRVRVTFGQGAEALRRAVDSTDVAPDDLDAVLLVGGSSRIPLVPQMISAELGRPVSVDVDPKAVVAAGAALATGMGALLLILSVWVRRVPDAPSGAVPQRG